MSDAKVLFYHKFTFAFCEKLGIINIRDKKYIIR